MTGFLADACGLIEFHAPGNGRLTEAARAAMRGPDVHVSPVTIWKIVRKVGLGKLPLPVPARFRGTYTEYLRDQGYLVAPMTWADAEAAATLPDHHRDPMDRFLVATALRMNLTIVTSDRVFRDYGVRTIW